MDEIKHSVREVMQHYMGDNLPPDDVDIREWGIDSVDALEMFAELESTFGIRFEGGELDFSCLNSIQEITDLLSQKLTR